MSKTITYTEPKKSNGFVFLPGMPCRALGKHTRVIPRISDSETEAIIAELTEKGCTHIRVYVDGVEVK